MAKKKRASLSFYMTDVADAIGIHRKTLYKHCKKCSIKLEHFSLTELISFIQSYKG